MELLEEKRNFCEFNKMDQESALSMTSPKQYTAVAPDDEETGPNILELLASSSLREYMAGLTIEVPKDNVSSGVNTVGGRVRNPLGLKLLISADDSTETGGSVKNAVLWASNGPEDSSPCSPVSTVSGSSTASGDDSGFSSDENRSAEKTHKLARTKSLRSALRSPTRAGKRKTVRFADSLGLDLEQKTYFESDDVRENESRILQSPFSFTPSHSASHLANVRLNFTNLPSRSEAEISHLARTQCVCLHSIKITDTNVSGVIHVLNLACDKQVCVRYTSDGWITFSETRAIFTRAVGSDGAVDSFSFFLSLPKDMPVGAICEFCVRYSVNGASYWDNNADQNYKLQCMEEVVEEKPAPPVAQKPANTKQLWGKRSGGAYGRRSFLDYDDEDDDDYYYIPSHDLHASKKGYLGQRFECSYGDHLQFY